MKVCESVNIFKQTLTEAILLLCKSELRFNQEFCIDGLLGITIDQNEVILIKINENLVAGSNSINPESSKSLINEIDTGLEDILHNDKSQKKNLRNHSYKQINKKDEVVDKCNSIEPNSPLNYTTNNCNSKSNISIKNEPEFGDYDQSNSINDDQQYVVDVINEMNANTSLLLSSQIINEITLNNLHSKNSLNNLTSQSFIKQEIHSPPLKVNKYEQSSFERLQKLDKSSENSRSLHEPCTNCGTRATTMWRRSSTGLLMCNACGLYLKLHGINRPLSYVRDNIQVRRRRRLESKDHLMHFSNEFTSEYLNFTNQDQISEKWSNITNYWPNAGIWTGVGNSTQPNMGNCSITLENVEGTGDNAKI